MLSRAQQIILKRAQAQARITDFDYRASLALVSGMEDCVSSKDPRLTDGHLDKILAYFEAIYWRGVDQGEPWQEHCNPRAVFQQRGYWADKNSGGITSRDRYVADGLGAEIAALEDQLNALGFGPGYCQAIKRRIQPWNALNYKSALARTLKSKQKPAVKPF